MSESLHGNAALQLNHRNPVDLVMGPGDPQPAGWFRFFSAGQRWEWSDAVARMHGYEPGAVVPDTDLLVSHKHPQDRQRVADVVKHVLHGKPFSSRHRIIDTAGHTRWVIVIGDRMRDETGAAIGTSGFYIDITETLQSDITNGVSQAAASRSVVEQAKGVLMTSYDIAAERAFNLLVWRSQETNTKVRHLAQRFLGAMADIMPPDTRSKVDHILLTSHDQPYHDWPHMPTGAERC